jgi:UDP-glucuronate 4-epimerase
VVASIDRQTAAPEPQFRIYNLGGSRATSLVELVDLIARAVGQSPQIVWKPEQPGEMKRTLADLAVAGRALGYAPKVNIEQGIPRFVKWWRDENPT